MPADGTWNVYLSGEIHSDWRERIADGIRGSDLDVNLLAPVTDHSASDDVGVEVLGPEQSGFWKDHKGAGVNAVRTQTLLRRADVVVVRLATSTGSGTRRSRPATPPRSGSRSSPCTTRG
jgi:YtoQ family protein